MRKLPGLKKNRKHAKGIGFINRGHEEQGHGQEKQQYTFFGSVFQLNDVSLNPVVTNHKR